jgi:hypothetical protein
LPYYENVTVPEFLISQIVKEPDEWLIAPLCAAVDKVTVIVFDTLKITTPLPPFPPVLAVTADEEPPPPPPAITYPTSLLPALIVKLPELLNIRYVLMFIYTILASLLLSVAGVIV